MMAQFLFNLKVRDSKVGKLKRFARVLRHSQEEVQTGEGQGRRSVTAWRSAEAASPIAIIATVSRLAMSLASWPVKQN